LLLAQRTEAPTRVRARAASALPASTAARGVAPPIAATTYPAANASPAPVGSITAGTGATRTVSTSPPG